MSAAFKHRFPTHDAAPELWRVAESGDVDELERLLPRVRDINAANKYGTTALIRAAYHGHEKMVRALLDHGADPNLTRNDRFTALALAAFFGHTETVKLLIEHGARKEVVTRCGTSAYMWATARTFDEAARYLRTERGPRKVVKEAPPVREMPLRELPVRESPLRELPARETPRPVVTLPERAKTNEVKTLKEPPEIWDLVQEVPRDFDPRSAFVARLASMKRSFGLRLVAGLMVCAMCGLGVWLLKRSQARNLQPKTTATESAAKVTQPSNVANQEPQPAVESTAPEAVAADEVVNNHFVSEEKTGTPRKVRVPFRQISARAASEETVETAPGREAVTTPPVASPKVESPKISSETAPKSKPGLSPQLITPAKNAPPKAKVIQWP